jgi:hypothetical protein
MVYCRYCGTQNRNGGLKCVQCGKPLSLIPNEPQPRSKVESYHDHNPKSRVQKSPIKDNYLRKDKNLDVSRENNSQKNINLYQSQNQRNDQLYNQNYRSNIRQNLNQNKYNDQNIRNYPKNFHEPQENQYNSQEYRNELKIDKTAVEWDVVIATALLVIILTAILQRILPFMAIFISLLIGLAYILVATKSKFSLFKSIPLAVLVILAISAYFSI